jgi:hypothetical protein
MRLLVQTDTLYHHKQTKVLFGFLTSVGELHCCLIQDQMTLDGVEQTSVGDNREGYYYYG